MINNKVEESIIKWVVILTASYFIIHLIASL